MNRHIIFWTAVACFIAFPVWAQKGALQTPHVIIAPARTGDFSDRIEALGTLRANETVVLTATITETVTAVHFNDGARVKKGDVLAVLNDREEQAGLNEEKAMILEAQNQVSRLGPLVTAGAAAQSTLDQWQRALATAKARMQAIESRLSDHIIRAPFAGVVGLRNISAGSVVQTGTKITTLDDDHSMKLDFAVPAMFLKDIQPGVPITAMTDTFQGRVFDGKVASVDSQVDPVSRAIMVRAILPNPDHLLKPGFLMRVDILTNQRQAVIIPEEAVVSQGKQDYVFVVHDKDGKASAEKREVVIGARRVGEVEVVKNLSVNDMVVTHGAMNIDDGASVVVKAIDDGNKTMRELLSSGQSKQKAP